MLETSDCIDTPTAGDPPDHPPCQGEVREHTSRSGCTTVPRCERHRQLHEAHVDRVEAGLDERYPGWRNDQSTPPPWFDPAAAGESWHPID